MVSVSARVEPELDQPIFILLAMSGGTLRLNSMPAFRTSPTLANCKPR